MSYADESKKVARRPIKVVELLVDGCVNVFSVPPCTASGPPGSECYNTFTTCQDPENYALGTPISYSLVDYIPNNVRGLDFDPALGQNPIIQCVKDIKFTGAEITPGQGLGVLGKVKITCEDFPGSHLDFTDPYFTTRDSVAGSPPNEALPGTWWTRWIARNRHYVGRQINVYTGFDNSFFPSDFEKRVYVIDRIDGPTAKGKITIIAKDPLKLASNKQATCPNPVSATLAADLSETEVITFQIVEFGESFDASISVVRIDDELISYITYIAGPGVFFGFARGAFNTEAVAHDAGASVQQVKRITTDKVATIVEELLTDYTDIQAAYIDPAYLDPEGWLTGVYVAATIAEPVGIQKLLAELSEQCMFDLWWDERLQKIRMRAVAPRKPAEPVIDIGDDINIVSESVVRKTDAKGRVSRVFMHYGEINPLNGTDPSNYSRLYAAINGDSESEFAYGSPSQRSFNSRWLSEGVGATVTAMISRMIGRLNESSEKMTFLLDAKDGEIEVGDHVQITSRLFQGPDGIPLAFEALITKFDPASIGHSIRVEAVDLRFAVRYAYIAPDAQVDYGAASAAQKLLYGFISPSSGKFADGGVAYRVI